MEEALFKPVQRVTVLLRRWGDREEVRSGAAVGPRSDWRKTEARAGSQEAILPGANKRVLNQVISPPGCPIDEVSLNEVPSTSRM